ncbi:hypothetical protein C8R44DRAFT_727923 [Mycena epipterygia]|nr:hypothetical protein C8R44DRAFT_727923 [Mycena epipterygia]
MSKKTSSVMNLSVKECKKVKEFIESIPDDKLMPDGRSGTKFPPSKETEAGGWRYDEQGFTTNRVGYNMQIQLNTEGGARGPSCLMLVMSAAGIAGGALTAENIRVALNYALDNPPRTYYLTSANVITNNHDEFLAAEVPKESTKSGKKKGRK